MVERGTRRVGGRELAREGHEGWREGVHRGLAAWCVLAGLVVLVLGAWCSPTRAGSGTTGVLGMSNIQQGAGGGEQAQPARRGVALQGPTRNSP
ncbi:MAG: hypothetical protein RL112_472 [Planctomycetota bacterium]